ncbi:MAG: ketoacyl-ACP synthase III [Bacteroidales bacterium]|nr:ketoacyl-ACP synthase III [Bacteroidales bacterium]
MKQRRTVIVGTGKYIPEQIIPNSHFMNAKFYDESGQRFTTDQEEIIEKFVKITGIKERRWATDNQVASDLGYLAAKDALESSGIDPESLDYIIYAHNFGDVPAHNKHTDLVPALASRVKHKLGIINPKTIAYDLPFGCPGWVQGMIHSHYFLNSGDAKRALIIGGDTLSRIFDPHDRDSMIYADGAGATILEAVESDQEDGILAHATRSDTLEHAFELWMDSSYNPKYTGNEVYLKMYGRKLYNYALTNVPGLVKESIDKAGLSIENVDKILIHQANEKMDEAIIQRLFRLYGHRSYPKDKVPMTISWLGNSSVATVPTLLDLILKNEMKGQEIKPGNIIVLASVGAGLNINSIVYKVPE